jgi:hypothetical protein
MNRSALVLVFSVFFITSATAVPVDPDAPDGVAAVYMQTDGPDGNLTILWALCTDGYIWRRQIQGPGSPWDMVFSAPCPVSEIADWQLYYLVKTDGAKWYFQRGGNPSQWLPFLGPCDPVIRSESQSLGRVKQAFH